jgi:predicted enzyme related to lactoylglutathione lyase
MPPELTLRILRDFLAPPERMPWGGVRAHFRDPDGNVVTLMSDR